MIFRSTYISPLLPRNAKWEHRRRGADRGFTTVGTLFLVLVLIVVVSAVASTSMTQVRLSNRGQNRAMALGLADAGVDDAVNHLIANHGYAGTSGTQTIYADPTTKKTPLGTFGTTVSAVPGDGLHVRVSSTAALTTSGGSSNVVALVRFIPMPLGDAAITANGNINITGNASIGTTPSNRHDANCRANGDLSMGGSSQVDGALLAAGYVSAPSPSSSNQIVSVTSNAPATPFLDANGITGLQNQIKAAVLAQNPNKISASSLGSTITAPAYIVGDISLKNKDSLTILGSGTVYVEGSIDMTGGDLINGAAILAVEGQFTMHGQADYSVTTGLTPTPTLLVFNDGFTTGTAITMNGGSGTDQQGIVYAANGDVKMNGNSTFIGSIVAGGSVTCNGSLTFLYPDTARSSIVYPGNPVVAFWGEGQ